MYLSYYSLDEKPFQISADPKFLWLGEKHKEAFAVLKYGIMDNKGFLLLTGDVGAGKTTLINALMGGLDENVVCATVPDPGLNKIELFNYIAYAFDIDKTFNNKVEFLIVFKEFLNKACDDGKKVLLIIDESQRLTQELLEEIRLLSNIERQSTKLLNIFFVGQVEFNSILLEERNKAVRQRITVTNHVSPLTEPETGEYVRHRLKIAGRTKKLFAPSAIREIHKFSKGYPRLINIICDICLLTGYVREINEIDKKIVLESYDSLNIKEPSSLQDQNPQIKPAASNNESSMIKEEPYLSYPVIVDNKINAVKIIGYSMVTFVMLFLMVAVSFLLYDSYFGSYKTLVKQSEFEKTSSSMLKEDKAGAQYAEKSGREVKKDDNTKEINSTEIDSAEISKTEQNNDVKKTLKEKNLFPIQSNRLIIDFSHNSNDFTETAYLKLDSLAALMVEKPGKHVIIRGYTDSKGDYSYNKSLSIFRANIVKSYLIGKGVPISRIVSVGMGPENPVGDNKAAEGRRANRRVEIEILESEF